MRAIENILVDFLNKLSRENIVQKATKSFSAEMEIISLYGKFGRVII